MDLTKLEVWLQTMLPTARKVDEMRAKLRELDRDRNELRSNLEMAEAALRTLYSKAHTEMERLVFEEARALAAFAPLPVPHTSDIEPPPLPEGLEMPVVATSAAAEAIEPAPRTATDPPEDDIPF